MAETEATADAKRMARENMRRAARKREVGRKE
jgi:hypothetical protein